MNGLAPHTTLIFDAICRLDCIKDYTLVGGTALSIQISNRLSEDLDFMSWRTTRNEKREVDWFSIKKQFESVGTVESFDILDINHIVFVVDGVKVSFYASPNYSPLKSVIPLAGNLKLADKTSIGAMKMEVMLRRSAFRDYYDIYSLLEEGEDIKEMIDIALKYSGHILKSKNLFAMLTNSDRFTADSNFKALMPKYDVTAKDIERRIRSEIEKLKY